MSPAIMTTQQSVVSAIMMAQQPRPFKQGGEPLMTARVSEVTAMMEAERPIPFNLQQAVVPHTTVPPPKIQAFEHEVMVSQNSFLAHRLTVPKVTSRNSDSSESSESDEQKFWTHCWGSLAQVIISCYSSL